jgi:hypothetical protein
MRSIGHGASTTGRSRPLGVRPQGAMACQRRSGEGPGRCASWRGLCQRGKNPIRLRKTCCFCGPEGTDPAGSTPANPTESQAAPDPLGPRSIDPEPQAEGPTLPVGGSRVAPAQAPRNQPGHQRTDPFTATEVIKDSTTDLKRGYCKRCVKSLIEFPNVGFGPCSTAMPARLDVAGGIRERLSAPNQRRGHL